MHSTRQREQYSAQKQPLGGRKGTEFLKIADENESTGQTTLLERLLIAVITVHFMMNGIQVSSENAYSEIYDLTKLFPLVEFPLFERSPQFISRYLLSIHKMIELFSQLFTK